jgi:hypothetical protein|tara:strand:+ start:2409 stop:2786 length:378 start_codon:yes stop_codon:yes gene_type:complete
MAITEGTVAFSNLKETEYYNGKDTGKFSIVITMEEDAKDQLENAGIKVKEYKDQPQRKFVTKYDNFDVVDVDGESTSKHIPYGSRVRILWQGGNPHPVHGVAPYFKKIKVLELSEGADVEGSEDF